MEKKRLFVDMDGTLCRWENVDELEALYEPGYFRFRPPVENVVAAVRDLNARDDLDVYILSAYLSDSHYALQEKREWLAQYMPDIYTEQQIFIPCGVAKSSAVPGSLKKTDYLLDDYTVNLLEWEGSFGTGIKLLNGINHTKGTFKGSVINSVERGSEGIYKALSDIIFDDGIVKDANERRYTIYQLIYDNDAWNYKAFLPYDELHEGWDAVDPKDYCPVYSGTIQTEKYLDDIWTIINVPELKPKDFRGHSLSVSDVIVMEGADGVKMAYYVDSFGFIEVPEFLDSENDAAEDDYAASL